MADSNWNLLPTTSYTSLIKSKMFPMYFSSNLFSFLCFSFLYFLLPEMCLSQLFHFLQDQFHEELFSLMCSDCSDRTSPAPLSSICYTCHSPAALSSTLPEEKKNSPIPCLGCDSPGGVGPWFLYSLFISLTWACCCVVLMCSGCEQWRGTGLVAPPFMLGSGEEEGEMLASAPLALVV